MSQRQRRGVKLTELTELSLLFAETTLLINLSLCYLTLLPLFAASRSSSPVALQMWAGRQKPAVASMAPQRMEIQLELYFQWIGEFWSTTFLNIRLPAYLILIRLYSLQFSLSQYKGAAQRALTSVEIIVLLKLCSSFILAAIRYSMRPI